MVQIWPRLIRLVYTQISPGHIWTTLYIKSVLWKVAKRLSYIEDARCLKLNVQWEAQCFVRLHVYGWWNLRNVILNKAEDFMSCWPCILVQSCKQKQLGAQFFLICLLLSSTCFGQLCAHHQEKTPYLCDTWYLSLYIDDCPVCRAEWIPPCIRDSHLYRLTNTSCRIGTVFSPDDGHIVARNMWRKAINTLRKILHQVHSAYKTDEYIDCYMFRLSKGHFQVKIES